MSSASKSQQSRSPKFYPISARHLLHCLAFILLVMTTSHVMRVEAGSRLIEPPPRSSLWRYGYGNPVDFNDDELNCGGYDRQYITNGGRCGVCGDPWDEPQPRKYEAGNVTTVNPRPVRVYHMGSEIPVAIDSSAHLEGQYEFRLCQLNSSDYTPDQSCFDAVSLPIRESELGQSYRLGQAGGMVSLHLVLPDNLTCTHCLLQWRHVTGNRFNTESCVQCESGPPKCHVCKGCGQQAWFQSCVDIAIYDTLGSHPAVRSTLTPEEVKAQWEQTLRDIQANCSCDSATTVAPINSSTPLSVSSTSDLSVSETFSTSSSTLGLASTTSSSVYVSTTSATTVASTTGSTTAVTTTTTAVSTAAVTTTPRVTDTTSLTNPTTLASTLDPDMPIIHPDLGTTAQYRLCYIPYQPPWYMLYPQQWCFQNCPYASYDCYYRICRPVRCPNPTTPTPTTGNTGYSWWIPFMFPELFEL